MNVELHLWTMPVRGKSPRSALERVLAPFRRENPGVEVRIWVVPWGTVWDRLMSALKGRHGATSPDLLHLDGLWTGTLAHLGLLKEITPRLWEMERENFLPALWAACRLPPTRRLFAAPWTLDLRVPHVRRNAPERAGLSPADLSSWEGLETLLTRAARSRARENPPSAGWEGESVLPALAPWIWTAGGELFSSKNQKPAFLSPEALRGAAFYRNLLADGPSAGLWTAPLGSLREPGVSVLPPPQGPSGRFSYLGGEVLALAAGSKHPEESERLFRHMISAGVQKDFAGTMGLLPPRLADAEEALPPADRGVFRESMACARVLPPDILLGSFERLLQRHLAAPARASAPWESWRTALEGASAEADPLFSLYESTAV